MSEIKELYKPGQRLHHIHFGPCKAIHGHAVNDKILLDLDAKEISYYVIGKGYKVVKEDENGENILYCPVLEVFLSADDVPNDRATILKKIAMNASFVL